jgi:hypothetical protein
LYSLPAVRVKLELVNSEIPTRFTMANADSRLVAALEPFVHYSHREEKRMYISLGAILLIIILLILVF